MKLFAYITRSPRSAAPQVTNIAKKAISHQFRLLNDKDQVKVLGTAFFRSEKSDKSTYAFGKDARVPLIEAGVGSDCSQIQYLQDEVWKTL